VKIAWQIVSVKRTTQREDLAMTFIVLHVLSSIYENVVLIITHQVYIVIVIVVVVVVVVVVRRCHHPVASQPINWAGQSPGAPKVLGAPSNFAGLKNHKYNNDMYESSIS